MTRPSLRSLLTGIACAPALLLLATRSPAQSPGTDPYKTVVVTAPSPYWGYTYTPYVVRTPLDGVAAIISAQGDFLVKQQEAALLREKVFQAKLVTHRARLEHWEWVLDFSAGAPNRQEERYRKEQVVFNANFVSPAEIYTAKPLNSLYNDFLKKRPELPAAGSTKINRECLDHIHFTVSGRANIGLLKDDKTFWPELLLRSDFDSEREQLAQLLARAREQVQAGEYDRRALPQLRRIVAACDERITREIQTDVRTGADDGGWSPRQHIEATRFLKQVTDLTIMLNKPDAAHYLAPLQGNTVAELVAHMKDRGVEFAPATAGRERSYVILHSALADEVRRLKSQETSSNNP